MKPNTPELFKALSGENRIRIIQLLKTSGPLGSKKIAVALGITPAAVSQHLRALKQVGLVRGEMRGYWLPYSIDVRGMEDCCGKVEEICRCVCVDAREARASVAGKTRLKNLVEYKKRLEDELDVVEKLISRLKVKET
jgi:ArsR family transcriptional regulator